MAATNLPEIIASVFPIFFEHHSEKTSLEKQRESKIFTYYTLSLEYLRWKYEPRNFFVLLVCIIVIFLYVHNLSIVAQYWWFICYKSMV